MDIKILQFPHSPFCEKARWALDYKGIEHELVTILPGLHVFTVHRYAPGTSVPVLLHGEEAIQGSDAIIDFVEKHYPEKSLTPEDEDARKKCQEIEYTTAESLGENLRQILYFYLLQYPYFIKHCFTHPLAWPKQLFFSLTYPLLRKKIYQTYVQSEKSVARAKREFEKDMQKLADMVSENDYLVGDHFTRADLSVASMLSLLVLPEQLPLPVLPVPDEHVRRMMDEYQGHPVSEWARSMYQKHRSP
jgi:glutathione S-transferase